MSKNYYIKKHFVKNFVLHFDLQKLWNSGNYESSLVVQLLDIEFL